MPLNKNALIRYQTLDKCFSNPGRRYSITDLLNECNNALFEHNPISEGIKLRQIYDDIAFMESAKGWSIALLRETDGRKKYYRYEALNFSINNSPLNEMEKERINSAFTILSRFKGTPQFSWVEEVITKLETSFGFKNNEREIISFDSNQYLKGIEYLGVLFNAIFYKKVLEIEYQSFKSNKSIISVIHPYYLKQYNNRWYLLGKSSKFETLSVRSLDRIISIKEAKENYIENLEINFDEYFEDIIGITKPKGGIPILIELHFTSTQAPYILTKPLHGSQKIKKNNEFGLTITIEVIPNYELKSLLLSFGKEVNVISPDFIIDELITDSYQYKKIPLTLNEDEERDFWSKNDSTEFIDWDKGEKVLFPKLKPSTKTISLRLPEFILEELKLLANKRDVPYQSLIKMFLKDRLNQELGKT
jgi:predicted DNA-binding transcriptional regulator YafY